MKRHIAAALSILAIAAGVGWKLASKPETSAGLQEVSLNQHSEHSQAAATNARARIRVRLSPNDFGFETRATADRVPHITVAAE